MQEGELCAPANGGSGAVCLTCVDRYSFVRRAHIISIPMPAFWGHYDRFIAMDWKAGVVRGKASGSRAEYTLVIRALPCAAFKRSTL